MTSQRKRLEKYIADEYGANAEHLWRAFPNYAVFRNTNNQKWFAIMMDVAAYRLGLGDVENADTVLDVLNVHCPISVVATLLPDGTFLPAYHMNKVSWTSIPLDGRLTDKQIIPLIDASFESVTTRVKK